MDKRIQVGDYGPFPSGHEGEKQWWLCLEPETDGKVLIQVFREKPGLGVKHGLLGNEGYWYPVRVILPTRTGNMTLALEV